MIAFSFQTHICWQREHTQVTCSERVWPRRHTFQIKKSCVNTILFVLNSFLRLELDNKVGLHSPPSIPSSIPRVTSLIVGFHETCRGTFSGRERACFITIAGLFIESRDRLLRFYGRKCNVMLSSLWHKSNQIQFVGAWPEIWCTDWSSFLPQPHTHTRTPSLVFLPGQLLSMAKKRQTHTLQCLKDNHQAFVQDSWERARTPLTLWPGGVWGLEVRVRDERLGTSPQTKDIY